MLCWSPSLSLVVRSLPRPATRALQGRKKRGAGRGGGLGQWPPDFGISIEPIQTMGVQIMPTTLPIANPHPKPLDFQIFLWPCSIATTYRVHTRMPGAQLPRLLPGVIFEKAISKATHKNSAHSYVSIICVSMIKCMAKN